MKSVLAAFTLAFLFSQTADAQTNPGMRGKSIGVSFILNDFTSAQRIRSSSFESVVSNDNFGKIKDMSPGLAVTYFKPLQKNIDFAGTLAGSFVKYPLPNRPAPEQDAFLIEADASAIFKMFDETYWVSPYVSGGIGASKYKSNYGAFLPLGVGFKVNFQKQTAVFVQTQYRIPVTSDNNNYHFMYSVGFSGALGKR